MTLMRNHKENISLNSATTHIFEGCRMVLPGIQALFGFQLFAVFNSSFTERLTLFDQRLHLVSMLLVILAVILVMAPAALHRHTDPMSVSTRLIYVSSVLLKWSMLSLAIGICLEIYIVVDVILSNAMASALIATVFLLLFLVLWVAVPYWEKKSGC